jgi:GNAT superfamily N-acetyltransferase
VDVRQAILAARLPEELEFAIIDAYERLRGSDLRAPDVAVRSSATAEDLPDASFAGQQETYLNVQGCRGLIEAVRRCFASLFTDRAISYRADKGFDHEKIALSVGVQRMVRSDLAASGVMFTLDTESGFRGAVLINAAYGLGENVVQGSVNPDEYYVFKPTLTQGRAPILQKVCGTKELKLIYDTGGGKMVKNVHFRYFSLLPLKTRIAHERLVRICFADYDCEIPLVAECQHDHNREVIGVGRLNRFHDRNEAELAIVVSDAWQNQGVGHQLLEALIRVGRAEKLNRITATILASNCAMLHVCRAFGFSVRRDVGGDEFKAELKV